MAFFDDFKKTVAEIGQGVSQKTQSFTDSVKINSQISDQKKELSRLYEDLGRKVMKEEAVKANDNYKQLLELIERGEQALKNLEEQLNLAKGAVPCKNCGTFVPSGNAFCQNCGAKVEVVTPPPVQTEQQYSQPQNQNVQTPQNYDGQPANSQPITDTAAGGTTAEQVSAFCTNCGQKLDGGVAFCTNCGVPVKK